MRDRCCACACVLQGTELPISHHKGGSYLYCQPCARFHNRLMRGVLLMASLLLAAGVIVMLANHLTQHSVPTRGLGLRAATRPDT